MKLKRILLELRFAQRPCKRGRLHAVEPAGLLAPLRFSMRKATHKGWLFAWWSITPNIRTRESSGIIARKIEC